MRTQMPRYRWFYTLSRTGGAAAANMVVTCGADMTLRVLDPRKSFALMSTVTLSDFPYSLAVAGASPSDLKYRTLGTPWIMDFMVLVECLLVVFSWIGALHSTPGPTQGTPLAVGGRSRVRLNLFSALQARVSTSSHHTLRTSADDL